MIQWKGGMMVCVIFVVTQVLKAIKSFLILVCAAQELKGTALSSAEDESFRECSRKMN